MSEEEEEDDNSLFWIILFFILFWSYGCAGVGEFFKGMWTGAKEAAPKAVDELSVGNWQAAAITAGSGIVGGGLLWWARGKRKKNAGT